MSDLVSNSFESLSDLGAAVWGRTASLLVESASGEGEAWWTLTSDGDGFDALRAPLGTGAGGFSAQCRLRKSVEPDAVVLTLRFLVPMESGSINYWDVSVDPMIGYFVCVKSAGKAYGKVEDGGDHWLVSSLCWAPEGCGEVVFSILPAVSFAPGEFVPGTRGTNTLSNLSIKSLTGKELQALTAEFTEA
jgi:hypothetical protein